MHVIRAKSAGFCFGVSLALQKLDKALKEHNEASEQGQSARPRRLATLGPIIHNPLLVKEYEDAGVVCLKNIEQAQPEDLVLIRAHGVPCAEEAALRERGCFLADATCPRVKAAQLLIKKACAAPENLLLLFGEADHPEVLGLVSYAACPRIVFSSLAELEQHRATLKAWAEKGAGSLALAAQTTQAKELFDDIYGLLQTHLERFNPEAAKNFVLLNTICEATRQRQEELLQLAGQVEAMVVVGGKNSGNTRRLAELAEEKGLLTMHIETPAELQTEKLAGLQAVGLTAGASTPAKHIDAVENLLLSL